MAFQSRSRLFSIEDEDIVGDLIETDIHAKYCEFES
jgi:hypothetical protein